MGRGRNFPFRGGKHSSYEGGSRATAFIKLPRSIAPDQIENRIESSLIHVSDIMPTLLSLIDGGDAQAIDDSHWKTGKGYDVSNVLLGKPYVQGKAKRDDILMMFDETKKQTAYRYGKWKLLEGSRGDSALYEEPTSDSDWIMQSFSFHGALAELLMHAAHAIDEDSSGTLSESIRELLGFVDTIWSQVLSGSLSLNAEAPPALFNLDTDPYESNDVAEQYPEIVEMLQGRIETLKASFKPSCNWFLTDSNIVHETVSWLDSEGKEISAPYHSPFVNDDDWENGAYQPSLFDVNPARVYGAWAIVVSECLLIAFGALFVWRRSFGQPTRYEKLKSQ